MRVAKQIGIVLLTILFLVLPVLASSPKCTTCRRDAQGRIARDSKAVSGFKRQNPKPPDCHRCEVDHVVPLHRGGVDHPGNMQWLPREVHQDKTRREAR